MDPRYTWSLRKVLAYLSSTTCSKPLPLIQVIVIVMLNLVVVKVLSMCWDTGRQPKNSYFITLISMTELVIYVEYFWTFNKKRFWWRTPCNTDNCLSVVLFMFWYKHIEDALDIKNQYWLILCTARILFHVWLSLAQKGKFCHLFTCLHIVSNPYDFI